MPASSAGNPIQSNPNPTFSLSKTLSLYYNQLNVVYNCALNPSISFAETRNRWRKRKRGRKPKPQSQDDEDLEDEEEEQDDDESDEQQHHHQNPNPNPNPNSSNNPTDAIHTEVLSDVVRISEFPAVVRHTVNRPHSSVMAIVDAERASQCGESRGNGVVLENISYGQVRALSVDGCSSGFVITPPEIVEGRGVVKRFGSDRVLVVPMHAGIRFISPPLQATRHVLKFTSNATCIKIVLKKARTKMHYMVVLSPTYKHLGFRCV